MLATRMRQAASGAAAASYLENVLALNPIVYWPMNETSGTVADNAEGTAARDGAYTGVTLNSAASPITGDNAGLWDGANDYVDVYTLSLVSALDVNELTIAGWAKVQAAGVWSDGTTRQMFTWLKDSANQIFMYKSGTTNQLVFVHENNTANKTITTTTLAGTAAWYHVAITTSDSNDRFRVYINGAQVGATLTGIGTGAWTPNVTTANIGANSNSGPTQPWSGYLSHWAVFASELSAADVLTLATAV